MSNLDTPLASLEARISALESERRRLRGALAGAVAAGALAALAAAAGVGETSRALADDKPAAPPAGGPKRGAGAGAGSDMGTWPTEDGGRIPKTFGHLVCTAVIPGVALPGGGFANGAVIMYFENEEGVIRVVMGGPNDPSHKVYVAERTD